MHHSWKAASLVTILILVAILTATSLAGFLVLPCPPSCGPPPTSSVITTTTTSNPPLSSIGARPGSGQAPLAVQFSATVTNGVPPYTGFWTFGDGSNLSGLSVSHTYENAGNYLVQFTVTDSVGSHSTSSLNVEVTGQNTTTTTTTSVSTTITSPQVVPYFLLPGWQTVNASVFSADVNSSFVLSQGITVSNIGCSATISYIAYNLNTIEISLKKPQPATIHMTTSEAPSSVWANSTEITSWSYSNGVLTIAADPYNFTIVFPTPPLINTPSFILILIIAVVMVASFVTFIRKRR